MSWARYADDRWSFRAERLILPSGESMEQALERDGWQRSWWGMADELELRVGMIVASRGCGKSTWTAALCVERLALEPDSETVVVSGDKEQAGIVHAEACDFIRRDARLASLLEIRADSIVNPTTGCRMRTMSSDVASSYGLGAKRTLVIFDEVWTQTSRGLLDSMLSTIAKKPGSRMLAITNAGYRDTAAWELRELCRAGDDPALRYWDSELEGVRPSWISEDEIERQSRLLPPSVFRRLWRNEWQSGGGDFLLEEQVAACVDASIDPLGMNFSRRHWHFIGVDLGLRHDRSVVTVVRKEREHVQCVHIATWYGSQEKPISLESVYAYVLSLAKRIPMLRRVFLDPWQGAHVAERWKRSGVRGVEEFTFTTQNLQLLSQSMWSYFRDGTITIPDHPELRDELVGLKVIERRSSWRIDHQAGGFSDHAIALGLAIVASIPDRGQLVVEDPNIDRLIEHFRSRVANQAEFGFGKRVGLCLASSGTTRRDVYSEIRLLQLLTRAGRLSEPEAEMLEDRIRARAFRDPLELCEITDGLEPELGRVLDWIHQKPKGATK